MECNGLSGVYRAWIKRTVDVAGALVGLAVAAVPMALIACVLTVVNGRQGPLFCHVRPGRDGRLFGLWKFRTMLPRHDSAGRPVEGSEQLTRVGRWLRAWSLDELPQLWNVLRGDMSLVGPRPLLVEYLPLYSPHQARRHEVRPGITGWAQVNGRNEVSSEERFDMDVWYVDHVSARLDARILWMTVRAVVSGRGVNAPNGELFIRWRGNE